MEQAEGWREGGLDYSGEVGTLVDMLGVSHEASVCLGPPITICSPLLHTYSCSMVIFMQHRDLHVAW